MQSSEHKNQEDGEPKLMLATHVDDMLWATKSGYEDRAQQFPVKCKDMAEKIEFVHHNPKGREQTDLARDHESSVQVGGRISGLGCKAMQCRPQFSHGVNKLQSVCGTATLDDLKFAINCCKKPRNHRTTDCSSKVDVSFGTKWRCSLHYRCQLRKRVEFPQSKRADDLSHWTRFVWTKTFLDDHR